MNLAARVGLLVLVLGGVGCSADEAQSASRSTHVATTVPAGRGTGAGADTADSVVVGGVTYEVTCARVDEAQLGAKLELDKADALVNDAAEIAGEDLTGVLALQTSGRVQRCPDAAWVVGLAGPSPADAATATEHARLRCTVPARPDDARCGEGGPFWYGTDPSVDGTEGDGRSAIWLEAKEPPPQWRLDPLEVVTRAVAVDSSASEAYLLRRVGLRVVNASDDEVLVEVLYQDITDFGELRGTEQREHHTLGKLAGRPGWYETTYIVAAYGDGDTDAATLDTSWAAGVDRVLVEVDRR